MSNGHFVKSFVLPRYERREIRHDIIQKENELSVLKQINLQLLEEKNEIEAKLREQFSEKNNLDNQKLEDFEAITKIDKQYIAVQEKEISRLKNQVTDLEKEIEEISNLRPAKQEMVLNEPKQAIQFKPIKEDIEKQDASTQTNSIQTKFKPTIKSKIKNSLEKKISKELTNKKKKPVVQIPKLK
jgi:hypothetical protein